MENTGVGYRVERNNFQGRRKGWSEDVGLHRHGKII